MRNISLKQDNVGDTLPAGDFNANLRTELQNAVESADFTLDAEGGPDTDTNMLGKTLALYGSASSYYQDSGSVNAYSLSRVGNLKALDSYKDGVIVIFKIGNTNTGASTVNVSSLGVKDITTPSGAALSSGVLVEDEYAIIRYNSSDDRFELVFFQVQESPDTIARNSINGLTLSNGADTDHDIDISDGECTPINEKISLSVSAITKQIDANWSAGTNQGGFPSSLSLSADTWYHVFIISSADGSTVDAGFDTSLTAANLLADATGHTKYRRIGSILTDGSQNIIQFAQINNEFIWDSPIDDFSVNNPGTSAVLRSVTVPAGLQVMARVSCKVLNNANVTPTYGLFTSPDQNDAAPSAGQSDVICKTDGTAGQSGQVYKAIKTNTSAQIRTRISLSGANSFIYGCTFGWKDFRGQE